VTAPLVRRSPTHAAEVVATSALTPRMRRVTVRAATMRGVVPRPAQDVELLLREPSGRRVKRRYTIRHARPEIGELDLDVLLHGSGPGSTWGQHATVGDAVELVGPRGKLELTPAAWHLMVGDESALPAFATIAEARPAGERAIVVLEVGDATDELPIPDAEVHWCHRRANGGDPVEPGRPDRLLAALAGLELPPGDGHAYLMGETRAVVALRAVLEARGLAHDAIFVKGYWNLGRPERGAGPTPA
jgi:NADPH-dependent ferric siderophore reductase